MSAETPARLPVGVRVFNWFAQRTVRLLAVMLYGFRVEGAEHLPRSGGAVLASNHVSFFDPLLLGATNLPRRVVFTPRTSLSNSLLYRFLTVLSPVVPIGRGSADMAATRRLVALLKAGEVVALFPEQTRSRDGTISPIRGGVQLLAKKAGVPICPVVIDGAYEVWPRERRWPRLRGRIVVRVGPAMTVQQLGDRKGGLEELRRAWIELGARVAEPSTSPGEQEQVNKSR